MDQPPARIVTLVLVTAAGNVLGRLAPFEVATPWWMDAEPAVRAARERHGMAVTIVRLLDAERSMPHGGGVTYLAEVDPSTIDPGRTHLEAWDGQLDDHPLRLPYARPGGASTDLAWADGILAGHGLARTATAEQVRTWNLSSLWRLPTAGGTAWLKVVPPFFAHEGEILARLAGERVPTQLGRDGSRILLAEVPGEDRYEAGLPEQLEMIEILVDLQARWLGRDSELLAIALPDWRGPALSTAIGELVGRAGPSLEHGDRLMLEAFVAGLPARLASIDACGLGDGLVHGDFHPGNVRGDPGSLVLLDWGDSGVGHPLLDQPAFLSRIAVHDVTPVRARWHAAWRRAVPGCDPDRAATLLAPLATARLAIVYQRFLDAIEPSERLYHRADVPDWLHRTAAILEVG